MKQCQDAGGRLPTEQELADIATALYGGKQGGGSFSASDSIGSINSAGSIGSGEAIPEALSGLGSSWYGLWSSGESNAYTAYDRYFDSSSTVRRN